jgi:hypothetical protein
VPLTAPLEHSPNPFLRQPHGLTLSSTTQPEIDESPPKPITGTCQLRVMASTTILYPPLTAPQLRWSRH